MKTSIQLLATLISFTLASVSVQAASKWWDVDGAGAGAATATGNWELATSNWQTTDSQTATPGLFAANDVAVFSAGNNVCNGSFTVTLTAAILADGITVEEGTVSIAGAANADTLGGGGTAGLTINIPSGLTTTIGAKLHAANQNNPYIKTGDGTLELTSSVSDFNSQLRIEAGTVSVATINAANATGPLGEGIASGKDISLGTTSGGIGTLRYTGATAAPNANRRFQVKSGGTGVFQIDGAVTLTIGGLITNSTTADANGLMKKTGTGALKLTNGGNTFGNVTISGGAFQVGGVANAGVASALGQGTSVTIEGGNTSIFGYSSSSTDGSTDRAFVLGSGGGRIECTTAGRLLTLTGGITSSPADQPLTVGGAGDVTISTTALNIRTDLTKEGTGILTLQAANTYGNTIINNGVLRLFSPNPLGSGLLTINGGVLELKSPTSMTRTLGTGNGNLSIPGGVSGFNAQGGTANVTIDNNASTVVTWGDVNFNPSVLVLNSSSASANNINFNNILDLGGADRTISVDTSTLGGTASLAGEVKGTGGIIKTGQGILRMNMNTACSYSGATAVQNGALQIMNADDRLPTGTTVTLGNGATSGKLILGTSAARSQTLAGLLTSGSGTANAVVGQAAGNSTLDLNIASGNNTFDGVLGGAGANENNLALTKSGTGTLTLTGVNTYTGNTTVSAGKLALSGSGSIAGSLNIIVGTTVGSTAILDVSGVAGGFTLDSSQTLKGHGTVNGAVMANGTLSPGASVGTLAFGGDLTVAGNLLIEVDKSLSPSNDVMTVVGTLTNAGTGTVTVMNLNGGLPLAAGDSFNLFNGKPVLNGQALTIVSSGGEVWTNKLEVDGSIAVLSLAPPAVPATNLTIVATGPTSFSLGGLGAANTAYGVYASTNVTTPMVNWWLIGTTNSDGGGVIQFLDTQATNAQRFYRFGQ